VTKLLPTENFFTKFFLINLVNMYMLGMHR